MTLFPTRQSSYHRDHSAETVYKDLVTALVLHCVSKKDTTHPPTIITASIARSATRRYLLVSYSEADYEVFRPTRATRCTDGDEIWQGSLLHAKFHPQSVHRV